MGIGSSAPVTVLPNSDLEELVETSDEWIATRTGIRKRHLLKEVGARYLRMWLLLVVRTDRLGDLSLSDDLAT